MEKESQYFQLNGENVDESHEYYFNDSDIAVMAANQLMQLSDEDDQHSMSNSTNNNDKNIWMEKEKEKEKEDNREEEVDQIYCTKRNRRPNNLVKMITEEIFGKDDDEVGDIDNNWLLRLSPRIMKRRYRSLTSIYRQTQSRDHHRSTLTR